MKLKLQGKHRPPLNRGKLGKQGNRGKQGKHSNGGGYGHPRTPDKALGAIQFTQFPCFLPGGSKRRFEEQEWPDNRRNTYAPMSMIGDPS